MRIDNKKVERVNSRLGKQKKQESSKSFSNPSLYHIRKKCNISDLLSPQRDFICWACGSSANVTTYHAAGGVLGVCDLCNGGIV